MPNSLAAQQQIAVLDARATRHAVTHEGKTVQWRRFGNGAPLVLLHGGHGSWMHWVRNIESLAAKHTVWVPNMPGYGDSDLPDGDTIDTLVTFLGKTLNQLVGPRTRISLAGFSFGGLVAAHLAATRPVERLTLLGPGGHASPRRQAEPMVNWREAATDAELDAAMRHNLSVFMLSSSQAVDDLATRVHLLSCQHTRFRSKNLSQGGGLAEALKAYGGPTLLIWGEHDVTADPATIAPALAAEIPQTDYRIVAGAGHWVQFEQAEAVNFLLQTWLGCGDKLTPDHIAYQNEGQG